jgi:outer membrane protein W
MLSKYKALLILLFLPICIFSQPLNFSIQGLVSSNTLYIEDDQGFCLNVDYNINKKFYTRLAISRYSAKMTTFYSMKNPFDGDFSAYSFDLGVFIRSKMYFIKPHLGLGIGYSINDRSIDKSTKDELYGKGYSKIEEEIKNAFSPYFHLGVKTSIYKNIFYLVEVKYTLLRVVSDRKYTILSTNEVLNVGSKKYLHHLFYGIGFGIEL